MPSPVLPNAYVVEVRGLLFGQRIENVWHCQGADPFDAAQAADIAAIFQTGYGALLSQLSQDITFHEVFVHNLAGVASGEFTLAITPPDAGDLTEDSEPGNVAFCVTLRTALSGRTTRGRKFFSGLAKGDVVANQFEVSRAGGLVADIQTMIGDLATNGTPLCIFSPTALTLVPVTTATYVDLYTDSQRRRLTGRGN